MTINIRVDRSINPNCCPAGTNSILYIGDDPAEATRVFIDAESGKSAWGNDNPAYGVILSVWNDALHAYVVKRSKGFTTPANDPIARYGDWYTSGGTRSKPD